MNIFVTKGGDLIGPFMVIVCANRIAEGTSTSGAGRFVSDFELGQISGVRRIFQWGVSVTSCRDDVSFSDVTAIIMP